MTPDVWVTIAVALLGSGALTAILTPLANRRLNRTAGEKARIDGAQVLTDTAIKLLAPLQAKVDEAARSIDAANKQLADANEKIAGLTRDLGESRQQVGLLTVYVQELITVIRDAGLPVPPHPADGVQ